MLCEPGRTITYSLYLPESAVSGITFRRSYALLDGWAVRAFIALGVPAGYREINDIISPRGKIAGAAQARRRGVVLRTDPDAVARNLMEYFSAEFHTHPSAASPKELEAANRLVISKYSTPAWVDRLP